MTDLWQWRFHAEQAGLTHASLTHLLHAVVNDRAGIEAQMLSEWGGITVIGDFPENSLNRFFLALSRLMSLRSLSDLTEDDTLLYF